jgi:hypothetical protein
MKKETAVLLTIISLISGFLIGREFPRHHYEALVNGAIVFDSSTGKVCDMRVRTPPLPPLPPGAVLDSNIALNNETPSGFPRCPQ